MENQTAAPAERRGLAARLFSRSAIGPVLLIIASLLVGIVQVPGHRGVSPVDEYVYIDYFSKVASQVVVHRGEETGTFARQELGCRGLRLLQPSPDARCELQNAEKDSLFPFHGATSAYIYTPLYFGITRVLAEPLVWAGVGLVDAGRFVGALWLAAAALFLYLALRRLKIHPVAATGVGLLMIGSLPAYWSNTYISTDATALFAGGLMLYLATRVDAGRSRLWFILGAAFVTLLKVQNLAAVAAAILFLVIRAAVLAYRTRASRAGWVGRTFADRRVITSIIALAAAFAGQVVWLAISSAIAIGPSPDMGVTVRPLGLTQIILQSGLFLDGATKGVGDITTFLRGPGLVSNYAVSFVAVAGVVGLLMASRWGTRRNAVAVATFAAALVSAPILSVVTYVTLGTYVDPPPARYGIALIPFFLACAALLLAKRPWPRWIMAGVGTIVFVVSLLLPQG
ncbi:hypothetical protein [Leifsonia aquatica]|jgi:hypothetical protein|uniref:hypothetical protein n=1 Tax=Leifsonia aquatica TaxID=144185 RepID=UPI003810E6AF